MIYIEYINIESIKCKSSYRHDLPLNSPDAALQGKLSAEQRSANEA